MIKRLLITLFLGTGIFLSVVFYSLNFPYLTEKVLPLWIAREYPEFDKVKIFVLRQQFRWPFSWRFVKPELYLWKGEGQWRFLAQEWRVNVQPVSAEGTVAIEQDLSGFSFVIPGQGEGEGIDFYFKGRLTEDGWETLEGYFQAGALKQEARVARDVLCHIQAEGKEYQGQCSKVKIEAFDGIWQGKIRLDVQDGGQRGRVDFEVEEWNLGALPFQGKSLLSEFSIPLRGQIGLRWESSGQSFVDGDLVSYQPGWVRAQFFQPFLGSLPAPTQNHLKPLIARGGKVSVDKMTLRLSQEQAKTINADVNVHSADLNLNLALTLEIHWDEGIISLVRYMLGVTS